MVATISVIVSYEGQGTPAGRDIGFVVRDKRNLAL